MNTRLIVVVLAALLGGGLLAMALLPAAPPATNSATTGKASVGGPFELTSQNDRRVSDKDFRGKLMLVYFGYTFCPDVCPAGLQVISAALDKLGTRADDVVPIFISLDPERDTPAKLKEYLGSFNPRLLGLTGTPEEIAAVAKAYRAYYKKVPDAKHPDEYSVDHTSIIYLMGRDGTYVGHASHASSFEKLAEQIANAL